MLVSRGTRHSRHSLDIAAALYSQHILFLVSTNLNSIDSYQAPFSAAFLGPRYWLTWLALALLWLLQWVPARLRAGLGTVLGDAFRLSNKKRRHIVEVNLQLCFPEWTPAQRTACMRQHYRLFAQTLLDTGVLWWSSPRRLQKMIQISGLDYYDEARTAGRPVILLTGHFISLEMGGSIISYHFDQIGLIKPAKNKLINWFMTRGRTRFGANLFLRSKGMRPVVRAIKAGAGFYYLPDEDHGPGKSIFVPFLGTRWAAIPAAARLVSVCGAAALPAACFRLDDGRYELRIKPALQNFPSGDPAADTRRVTSELEAFVREAPAQYMWTFKLFKTRPEGEASPYASFKKKS